MAIALVPRAARQLVKAGAIQMGEEIAAAQGVAAPTTVAQAFELKAQYGFTPEQQVRREAADAARRRLVTGVVTGGIGAALLGAGIAARRRETQTELLQQLAPPAAEAFPTAPGALWTYVGEATGAPSYVTAPQAPERSFWQRLTGTRGAAAFAPAAQQLARSWGVTPRAGMGITTIGRETPAAAAAAGPSRWSRFWEWTGKYAPSIVQALGIGVGAAGVGVGAAGAGVGYGAGQILEGAGELRAQPTTVVYAAPSAAPAPSVPQQALPSPGPAAPTQGINWQAVYLMR